MDKHIDTTGYARCNRCGRKLRNVYMVNGLQYGKVCAQKMGWESDFRSNFAMTLDVPVSADPRFSVPEKSKTPIYVGIPRRNSRGGHEVWVVTEKGRRELDPKNDLRDHSPDGFMWGYGGSGPSQLALALACDALASDEKGQQVYMELKWNFVAKLPQADRFEVAVRAIRTMCEGFLQAA